MSKTAENAISLPQIAREQYARFVAAIHPNGIAEIRRIRPAVNPGPNDPPSVAWSTWHAAHELPGLHGSLASDNAAGWNIYIGVNPREKKGKRKDAAVPLSRCAFIDFDDMVDLTAVAAFLHEKGLPSPSIVVLSGHGIHIYWLLSESTSDMGAWRELQWDLAVLAKPLNADVICKNPERIMRLPGFLNVKRDPFVPCILHEFDPSVRIDFSSIRQIVPVRPPRPMPARSTLPAELDQDSERKLKRYRAYMSHCADSISGQSGHNAMYRAACEIIRFGLISESEAWEAMHWFNEVKSDPPWSEWELKHKLEDARKNETRVGIQLSTRPSWGIGASDEEPMTSLQKQWHDQMKTAQASKVISKETSPAADPSPVPTPLTEPAPTPTPAPTPVDAEKTVVEKVEPLRLAEHYIDSKCRTPFGDACVARYLDDWWYFDVGGYARHTTEEHRARLYSHVDELWTIGRNAKGVPTGDLVKLVANANMVREIDLAMPSRGLLVKGIMPQWLDCRTSPAVSEVVAFRNGLLDTKAYGQGKCKLIPPTPKWFSGVCCPYDFDPRAKCPAWMKYLKTTFEDDEERIALQQEWFGLQLVPDNSHEKLMLYVGKPRSGKGTSIMGMTAMLGEAQVAFTSFAKLASRFGLHPLVGKLSAILPDAHISRSTDDKAALEALKSISGGDPQSVDRKGVDELPHVPLMVRFTIAVNELPKLPDAAGALKPRLNLLHFGKVFAGEEDKTLKRTITAEAPGIAVWALEGLRRLREKNAFTVPAESERIVEQFERTVSPIKSFIHECCKLDATEFVPKEDLFLKWQNWCRGRGDEPGNLPHFSQKLVNAEPTITTSRKRDGMEKQFSVYIGIGCCAG